LGKVLSHMLLQCKTLVFAYHKVGKTDVMCNGIVDAERLSEKQSSPVTGCLPVSKFAEYFLMEECVIRSCVTTGHA